MVFNLKKVNLLILIAIFLILPFSIFSEDVVPEEDVSGEEAQDESSSDEIPREKGNLYQEIYNPFDVIAEDSVTPLKEDSKEDPISYVEDVYADFKYKEYDSPNEDAFLSTYATMYCLVGGMYDLNIWSQPNNVDPDDGEAIYYYRGGLYSCITTQDLINKIVIPDEWENQDLTLYCNDGKFINSMLNNFDFITNYVDTYKACILRNNDQNGLAIVYGFDVGNRTVDNHYEGFFDNETNSGSIMSESEFSYQGETGNENEYHFKYNGDKSFYKYGDFYFTYDDKSSFYILRTFSGVSTKKLTDVFQKDIGLSRIALFRSFGSKKVYGYESAAKLNNTVEGLEKSIKPIYKIEFENIDYTSAVCKNMLAFYDAKDEMKTSTDKIMCASGTVWINSMAIDGNNYGKPRIIAEEDNSVVESGGVESFNIFKNIVLSIN